MWLLVVSVLFKLNIISHVELAFIYRTAIEMFSDRNVYRTQYGKRVAGDICRNQIFEKRLPKRLITKKKRVSIEFFFVLDSHSANDVEKSTELFSFDEFVGRM